MRVPIGHCALEAVPRQLPTRRAFRVGAVLAFAHGTTPGHQWRRRSIRRRGGAHATPHRPARRTHAAAHPGRVRGADPPRRPRPPAARDHRGRTAALADPVGSPGSGKTTLATSSPTPARRTSSTSPRSCRACANCARSLMKPGLSCSSAAHHPVRRRDPPLQQGAAGRVPAHVEDGTVILIGATTENPSFEVIAPLLSRTSVLVLEPLPWSGAPVAGAALADPERGSARATCASSRRRWTFSPTRAWRRASRPQRAGGGRRARGQEAA